MLELQDMKRKRLMILVIVMVVLGVGWTVYSKWHTFFPSQQMKELRQLEAILDLPKPKYRNEDDLGLHKDMKGASHYDRHIALSYEDASVLNTLRSRLLADSWQEQAVDSIGTNSYISFKKGTGSAMQCVSGNTKPKDSDGITLYISLQAAGELSCNPAPGTQTHLN